MILVPRFVAIILFLLLSASIVGLGLFGYRAVQSGGSVPEETVQVEAEELLYAAILCFVVVVFCFLGLAGRTRHIGRELDKMVEMSKVGEFTPELSMRKLGAIGRKVALVYFQLSALSEKKSSKISAMSNLQELLVANMPDPVLITDVAGKVIHVSRRFADRFEVNRSEILNDSIEKHFSDARVQNIAVELDKMHGAIERDLDSSHASITPIYSREGMLTYLVWAFDRPPIEADFSRAGEPAGQRPRVSDRIRRAFARRSPQDRSS